MPFYGMPSNNASTRPVRKPSFPSSAATPRRSGILERSFPERIEASDPAMSAIEFGASLPGYAYERPLALANSVAKAFIPGYGADSGPIDDAAKFLNGLPVVGDITRGIGTLLEGSNNLFPAVANARTALGIQQVAGRSNDDLMLDLDVGNAPGLLGGLGTSLRQLDQFVHGRKVTGNEVTVGQFLQDAEDRGFSRQDIADIQSGRKGIFDWGSKRTNPSPLIDLGGRLFLDPLNATMLLGPARIASKLPGAARTAGELDRLLRLADARAIVKGIPELQKPALSTSEGVTRLRTLQRATGITDLRNAGRAFAATGKAVGAEGITARSLGVFLMGMGRGGSALLSGYRKAAVGTTLGQFAVNAVDDALADKSAVPGPLNDLFILGRAIRDDRPLSEGMLFNLWALTHFPARNMAGAVTDAARGKIRYWFPKGQDIEMQIIKRLEGKNGGTFEQQKARFLERMGGAEGWLDFLAMVAIKSRQGRIAAAFAERPSVRSMLEAQEQARLMNKMAMDEVRLDPIDSREAVDALMDWATGARDVRGAEGGLRATFDPERFYSQWASWRSVATQTSALADGAVVPALNRVLIKTHVQIALGRFRKASRKGMVSPEDATRIILDNPALMTHSTGDMWARLLIRDHEPVKLKWIEKRLRKAEEDAVSLKSALAPAEQWEARAAREAEHRAGFVKPDGTLDYDRMPTDGDVRVSIATASQRGRRNAGFPAQTLDDVAAQRLDPRVADITDTETVRVFDESGFAVEQAQEGIRGNHGALDAAVEYTLDPRSGPQTAAEVGETLLWRNGGEGVATTVIVGRALDTHRLTANAMEFRWTVGPHDADRVRAALETIRGLFDDFYIDDTAGVYRVVIPESQAGRLVPRIEEANLRMGQLFPERSVGGRFEASNQRAWTETIRDTGGNRRGIGRNARAAGTERSAHDVRKDAATSSNWLAAREGFRERDILQRDARERGSGDGLGVAAQPGPDAGPVREAAPAGGAGVGAGDTGRGLEGVRPEGLKWLQDRDAEAGLFVPRWDASLTDRFTTDELQPLAQLQQDLVRYGANNKGDYAYTLASAPRGATPFQIGQGKAYQDLAMVRQIAGDTWKARVGTTVASAWHIMFSPVYTKQLADDMKQEFMSDLIGQAAKGDATISPSEVNHLLRAAHTVASQKSHFPNDVRLYQRLDMLPPDIIEDLAHGRLKVDGFEGFSPEALKALGKNGTSNALRRSSSRFFRKIEQTNRARSGEGNLGKILDRTFKGASKVYDSDIGKAGGMIRAWYPVFRFISDLRWHLMNAAETRIIGGVRHGVRQVEPDQLTTRSRHAMGRVPTNPLDVQVVKDDSLASGWLDNRRIEGIVGPAFDAERMASTRQALLALAEDDPILVTLRRRYGENATADELVDGLDRMMYDWDTKGTARTMTDEAAKVLDDADYEAMRPFIQSITRTHERIYRDVIHSFRGNTNRSNLERIANSYFLYWPISYQLKVAKVLFDTLTYRSFGRQTDLIGAWTVDRLLDEHKERLVNDGEYRRMFEDHPELWRAAGMFLPITPMDIGVSLSRFTRYTVSALGSYLNLFPRDETYPDLMSPDGIFDFSSRVMNMGPLYTADLLARVARELRD